MGYLQTDRNLGQRLDIPGMLAGTVMDPSDCKSSMQDEQDLMGISHVQSINRLHGVSSFFLPKRALQTSHPIQRPSGYARDSRHAVRR
jgi:hypothetical protein